ncbi:DUF1456 family protein [Rhodohalobacter sp. 614A]|uniref:DUF1456 family protein n=1 Tax=Rhodohalobacter sp. 614A TaxID=2908649 RepID=UPI001F1B014F|nr:DUF1456 family protein [Rhodohalobacter sp. 614A]
MRNDDIIQSIRYILDAGEGEIANILKLADYQPKREEISYIFDDSIPEDQKVDTTHELTAYFLDGLIYYKRGKSDKHPPRPIRTPVTNNMVLKKLRVAFKLRDDDILDILRSTGFSISKSEVNALFQKEKHSNYMKAGDQVLRYFFKGLASRVRKD